MNEIKIGVVIADENEYNPAVDVLSEYFVEDKPLCNKPGKFFKIENNGNIATVHMVLSGIGKINTASAAALLLSQNDILANFGYAGGVSGVNRGDILIGTSFVEHDFDISVFGYETCEKPGQEYIYSSSDRLNKILKKVYKNAKTGRVATGDSFVCEESTSEFLRRDLLASACDMESAAAAYTANFMGKEFVSFKQISDGADDDATADYREMNDSNITSMGEIFRDFLLELIK